MTDTLDNDERRVAMVYQAVTAPAGTARWRKMVGEVRPEPANPDGDGLRRPFSLSRLRRPMIAATAVAVVASAAVVGFEAKNRGGGANPAPSAANSSGVLVAAHLGLTCRLPLWFSPDRGQSAAGTHGFLSYPDGAYAEDSTAPPGHDATYSAALGHWLPADGRAVAPDGQFYVTVTVQRATSVLRRVDAGGQTSMLWEGAGHASLVGVTSAGVFLDVIPEEGGRMTHLRIDPATRVVHPITTPGSWGPASGDYLWGDSGEQRLDVQTGQVEKWFDVESYLGPVGPGDVTVGAEGAHSNRRGWSQIGLTADGFPIIRVGGRTAGTPYSVVIVSKPGQPTVIAQGTAGAPGGFDPSNAVADSQGIWFADYSGSIIWHYAPATGLQQAATVTDAGKHGAVFLAGGCS